MGRAARLFVVVAMTAVVVGQNLSVWMLYVSERPLFFFLML